MSDDLVDTDAEDAPRGVPRWRTRLASAFRADCGTCGYQFQLDRLGRIPNHVDVKSKPALVSGRWYRARCAGSGRPPA